MEDIKLQEVAINALRSLVNDEDRCNAAIRRELEKGPARIRVLSREELKIEIKKYKNISLRIAKEIQKNKGAVPSYAKNLLKEFEDGNNVGEGMKKMKEGDSLMDSENLEEGSLFEMQSEFLEN